jgi:hypothetical protein
MASSQSARFFAPKPALVSLLLLVLGVAVGASGVLRFVNDHVISLQTLGLGGVLVFAGGAVFFTTAFPKGCQACKKAFTMARARFAPAVYDQLASALPGVTPAGLSSFAAAPNAQQAHWSELELSYCAGCRQHGEARVIEERNNGQYDAFVRGTKPVSLSGEQVAAALSLAERRRGS